ncbi:ATP-binding protein [Streptomyces beihaiensis]|uniref:Uncharacterized protein n=1 Tax=Streptomyces beihaiensis TaxID=2984495 RepID=A0ABT3U1P5_9ACTN|nr:hypothetical protein [Streptomyces beihaiensis]MCX3062626.1 hypothetical protein [Streptomyces beihaiensis]
MDRLTGRLPGPRRAGDDAHRTRLIGRGEDLRTVNELLCSQALVTVTGAAGIGKSALAREAADHFDGEVLRLRLWPEPEPEAAAMSTPEPDAAATSTGASAAAEDRVRTALAEWRGGRGGRGLLLLDDADPVRLACIGFVRELLETHPELVVLVTARQPLGVGQEQVVRLGPLPMYEGDGLEGAERADGPERVDAAVHGPAVRMFMEGARRWGGSLTPSAGDDCVADVCRRTGGVPLALELAARQTRRRSVAEVAALLATGVGWLRDDEREGPARHRSMDRAAGAVYGHLERDERIVWARASVFAGEFDEAAAMFVCQSLDVPTARVPSVLSRLATMSVLEAAKDPGGVVPVRYRMNPACRDFGRGCLRAAAEWPTAVDRHFAWQCSLGDAAADLWYSGHPTVALDLLRGCATDLRAALVRSTVHGGRVEDALALAVDLWFWWGVCGHPATGHALVRGLLRTARHEQVTVPAAALWLEGWLAARLGRPEAPLVLGEASRAAVAENDLGLLGQISDALGIHYALAGDRDRAVSHLEDAVLFASRRPLRGPAAAISRAVLACNEARSDPARARACLRRALSDPAARDDLWVRCTTGYALALIDHLRGNKSKAWRRASRVLADAKALGAPAGVALTRELLHELRTGRAPAPPTAPTVHALAVA